MTIAKAIALIKLDIEYYKKQTEIMSKFTDESLKKCDLKNSPSDSMRSMGNIIETLCSMMSYLYSTQIKYYEDIITVLESTKKQKQDRKMTTRLQI